MGEVLQELVDRSKAASIAGEFRVESTPGGHHVVPSAITGKSGTLEPYSPPLETSITLAYREENALEMIQRLTAAITAASGIKLVPGTLPTNRFAQARAGLEAQNERARDVLWRTLQSIGPDLSWQLLCDAGETAECALNVHLVGPR